MADTTQAPFTESGRLRGITVCLLLLAIAPRDVICQPTLLDIDGAGSASDAKSRGYGQRMDYGPFLTYSVSANERAFQRGEYLALKGIVVKLDNANAAAVCFDTDTLRMAAAWTGGWL